MDCIRMDIFVWEYVVYGELYKLIGVGSALLVLTGWANARASSGGMSDEYRLPRFFCIVTATTI